MEYGPGTSTNELLRQATINSSENNPPKNTHSCMDYLKKTTATVLNVSVGIPINMGFGFILGGCKGVDFAMKITGADNKNSSILQKVAAIFTAIITMPAGIVLGMVATPFLGVKEGWDNKSFIGGQMAIDRYLHPKSYWINVATFKENNDGGITKTEYLINKYIQNRFSEQEGPGSIEGLHALITKEVPGEEITKEKLEKEINKIMGVINTQYPYKPKGVTPEEAHDITEKYGPTGYWQWM